MCGISGLIQFQDSGSSNQIRKMAEALEHRGPDKTTYFSRRNVSFAHNRLSIIDIEGGAQPFVDEERDIAVIANGEIYNFVELRKELISAGAVFKTQSDCEVILHAYKILGKGFVTKLRGMFAFAIYDGKRNRLILGRDRMGEKPLYYTFEKGVFLFSSELQSLLAGKRSLAEINKQSIVDFFRYQYIPEPQTLFHDVHKLPRSALLELEFDSYNPKIETYWNPWTKNIAHNTSKEDLFTSLSEAIKLSSRSDVPLGISLSGGLDSSLLAAQISEVADQPLSAVSLGYEGNPSVDERAKAKWLSERLGIQYIDVEIQNRDVARLFEDTCTRRDEPVGDIAGVSYNAIMKASHENGLKVMFAGQGADELFWGYDWVRKAAQLNTNPNIKKSFLGRLFSNANLRDTEFQMFNLQPFTNWTLKNETKLFPFVNDERLKSPLETYGSITGDTDIDVMRLISDFYLIGNGITQMDRISMSHSVETRLPFLDYKFVENAISVQHGNEYFSKEPKVLLKEYSQKMLPDEVIKRPKQGFSPPVPLWQKTLRESFGERLIEGHLCKNDLLSRSIAEKLSKSNISDSVLSTISRLAISLELTISKHLS